MGTPTLALGSAMLARMNARQLARPLMQELAEATGRWWQWSAPSSA